MRPSLLRRGLVLFLLFLCALNADAEAGRWKLFGKSMTGTRWHMDTETITRPSPEIVSVWVRSIPDKVITDDGQEEEEPGTVLKRIQEKYFGEYEYAEGLWELECSKSLFRLLYFCVYSRNGDIVTSRVSPDSEWAAVLPGSAGEALLSTVCAR
jgi:hypothetical protein